MRGRRVRVSWDEPPYRIALVVEGADDRRPAVEPDGYARHGPEKWDEDMARQRTLERAGRASWRAFGSQWLKDKEYWWNALVNGLDVMGIKANWRQRRRWNDYGNQDMRG